MTNILSLLIIMIYFTAGVIWQVIFFNLTAKQIYDIMHERFPNAADRNIKKAIVTAKLIVITFWPYYFIKETIDIFRRGNKDDKTDNP